MQGRLQRMTGTVPFGRRILKFLTSQPVQKLLAETAERGGPAVSAISKDLLTEFGSDVMRQRAVKQFVGLVIASVLRDHGFILDRSGARLRSDPVFVTGSIYRRHSAKIPANARPLLQRVFDSLTAEERIWSFEYLKEIKERIADSQEDDHLEHAGSRENN